MLPPLVQSNFKSVIDHILTNKQNRVYEGLYAAVSNGDEIMTYCHYKDPLAKKAFGVEKLTKILQLKKIDENKWQIKEAKVVWYTVAESNRRSYLRTHPDAELWKKSEAKETPATGVEEGEAKKQKE